MKSTSAKKYDHFQIISGVILFFSFTFLLLFLNNKLGCFLNSDMSSEMILGKHLSQTNRLLSEEWYYATELRVFDAQLLYSFFFRIFQNWHTVRMLSIFTSYLLFLAAYWFLCSQLRITKYYLISSALLFIPFSMDYIEFVLTGLYYLPHICWGFIVYGLTEKYITGKNIIILILLAITSLYTGLLGMRQLFLLNLPIFLCETIIILRTIKQESFTKQSFLTTDNIEKRGLIAGIVSLFFSLTGFAVNSLYFTEKYHLQNWGNGLQFYPFSFDGLEFSLNGFLTSLGYVPDVLHTTAPVTNVCCFFIVIIFLYSIYEYIKDKKKENNTYNRLVLFILSSMCILWLITNFTNFHYHARYTIQIHIYFIPLLTMFLANLRGSDIYKKMLSFVLLSSMFLTGSCIYLSYINVDNTHELQKISDYLVEQNVINGYATFWNANILTELSNGKIDVWTWCDGGISTVNDIDTIYPWQQLTTHEIVHPSNKVFILLKNSEVEKSFWKDRFAEIEPAYMDDDNVVYIIDSYETARDLLMN